MQDKPILVSVASHGRENYCKAQLSLIKSSIGKFNGDYLMRSVDGYCDNYMGVKIHLGGWPTCEKYGTSWQHKDMPYQFKPFAIQQALEMGYKRIMWADSTIRIMKDIEPLWEQAATHGILAWDNEGHPLDKWIAPHAAEAVGIDPKGVKQIMSCAVLFDFNHPKTQAVFDAWIAHSLDGSFQEKGHKNHRHDQALLSALLHKHGIEVQPYGPLAYPHYTPVKPYILNWGVV